MNHDTPGAVPSDDFPFLGPAVSPRRREGGVPAPEAGELTGPFVGGAYGSSAAEEAPGVDAEAEAGSALSGFDDAFAGESTPTDDGGEGGGEELPAAEWAEDDFPWLVPSESPEGAGEREEVGGWRATGEVEELAQPEAEISGDGPAAQGVDHFSWIGERLPEEQVGEPWEDEGAGAGAGAVAEGDEEPGGFPWDEVRAEEEAEGFGAGGGDFGGFDSVSAGAESWGTEWSPEPAGPEGALERTAEPWAEDAEGAARPGFDWGKAAEEVGPASADRWDAGAGFQVEDEGEVEGVAGWAEQGEGGEGEAAAAEAGGGGEAPVEATPLPVGEWEPAPDEGEVHAEVAAGAGAGAADPLLEVADRLERIARALRSGKPIEAVEEGDPLQLLITGYALGYSQARRGGR